MEDQHEALSNRFWTCRNEECGQDLRETCRGLEVIVSHRLLDFSEGEEGISVEFGLSEPVWESAVTAYYECSACLTEVHPEVLEVLLRELPDGIDLAAVAYVSQT